MSKPGLREGREVEQPRDVLTRLHGAREENQRRRGAWEVVGGLREPRARRDRRRAQCDQRRRRGGSIGGDEQLHVTQTGLRWPRECMGVQRGDQEVVGGLRRVRALRDRRRGGEREPERCWCRSQRREAEDQPRDVLIAQDSARRWEGLLRRG